MSRHWSETRLTKHPTSTPAPATSAAGEWTGTERDNWKDIQPEDATASELRLVHLISGPKPEWMDDDNWRKNMSACVTDIRNHVAASLAALREQADKMQREQQYMLDRWEELADELGVTGNEGYYTAPLEHVKSLRQQLATAQKEASEAQAALRQKDEIARQILDGLGDNAAVLLRELLAIQPGGKS